MMLTTVIDAYVAKQRSLGMRFVPVTLCSAGSAERLAIGILAKSQPRH
jgi:hypothetical protein